MPPRSTGPAAVIVFCAVCWIVATSMPVPAQDRPPVPPGHSVHGEAFDEGPRQRAGRMAGVGEVRFPVTTPSPDAQAFFEQGVAQLHTFCYFESERSFREALFHDPACAMALWGMAMSNANSSGRARAFLARARERMEKATDRERRHIEALEAYHAEGKSDADRRADYIRGLEAVVLAYPDDIEAKAFLAWAVIGGSWSGDKISSHVALDALIEEVLRKSPMHPGAHHYRIHLWDHRDPAQAVRSAELYHKAAPGIAHAWHMPGHIYNGLSRWHDAVYQQEGSARVDHAHMLEHRVLPFQIHNYAHNQHYLIANIAHTGAVSDGIAFSRNLVETPRDPGNDGAQRLGRISLLRVLLRYERWDEILGGEHLEWSDGPEEAAWAAYGRGFAHLGKGDRARAAGEAARLDALAGEAAKKAGGAPDLIETARLELKGRLAVSEGRLLEGFDLLAKGAKLQVEKLRHDLAGYPRPFLESVGLAHLEARDWGLAEACFRGLLEVRHDTLPSLAGLVEACWRGGKAAEAVEAYARFHAAAARADRDLACRRRLEALGINVVSREPPARAALLVSAAGLLQGSGGGASAGPAVLSEDAGRLLPSGPRFWAPSPAPDFDLAAQDGFRVRLSSLRGKRLVIAFFLGGACAHCVDQLVLLGKEKEAFEKLEVQVLAVSEDPPEKARELRASPKGAAIYYPLLQDPGRAVAKAYGAHDTFEDLALHGLFFIDRDGGIRWSRASAQPFTDMAFLKGEIERVGRLTGR
ncbi:MAG: redoxin domain-containing protein [Planctomycetes bacterium]|nr:redoxin domain-containing protein [Planctomycetota bacterium]